MFKWGENMAFVEFKGMRVHYLETGTAAPDQKTLLLIHGAGGSSHTWDKQLSGLQGHLIALDLPGHEESGGEAQASISAYREFVWEFSQALGLKRFVLVGHSMGGGITLDFAQHHSEVLEGMILVDSGARLKVNPETLKVLEQGKHPLGNVQFMFAKNTSGEVLEQAARDMEKVPPSVYYVDFQACDRFNILDQVKDIKVPALILCGQEDRMTLPKFSEFLQNEIAGSQYVIIPRAGHMAMLEQPEIVNQAIREFVGAI